MTRYRQRPERVFPGRKAQALGRREGRMNVIGQRLREARLAQDPPWSLEDLSQALAQHKGAGLSPATLGKVERGERSAYDFEVAAFIQVLALDPGWLLGLPSAGKLGEDPSTQDPRSDHNAKSELESEP